MPLIGRTKPAATAVGAENLLEAPTSNYIAAPKLRWFITGIGRAEAGSPLALEIKNAARIMAWR